FFSNTMVSNLSLVLLIVVVGFNPCVVRSCFIVGKVNVYVLRNIASDSNPLKLHCFSGNDDLGNHTLFDNQNYHWSFCMNVLPTTKFFCNLQWGNKRKGFPAFSESYYNWMRNWWVAKDDGIY
ncbi:hypothetical protein M569_01932, partial [Genlisea aurea]